MTLLLLVLGIFGLVMLAMAVGVIFSGRCLRGSCGGPEVLGPNGEALSCETCPLKERKDQIRREAAEAAEALSAPG